MGSIPRIIQDNIDNFVAYGNHPGAFCEAVMCDKLYESLLRADLECQLALRDIVVYVRQNVPAEARGSTEAMSDWSDFRRRVKERKL